MLPTLVLRCEEKTTRWKWTGHGHFAQAELLKVQKIGQFPDESEWPRKHDIQGCYDISIPGIARIFLPLEEQQLWIPNQQVHDSSPFRTRVSQQMMKYWGPWETNMQILMVL